MPPTIAVAIGPATALSTPTSPRTRNTAVMPMRAITTARSSVVIGFPSRVVPLSVERRARRIRVDETQVAPQVSGFYREGGGPTSGNSRWCEWLQGRTIEGSLPTPVLTVDTLGLGLRRDSL